jgi:predicted transcriptional regulator
MTATKRERDLMIRLICRPDGASISELARRTGWTPRRVSEYFRWLITHDGLELIAGRETVYHST